METVPAEKIFVTLDKKREFKFGMRAIAELARRHGSFIGAIQKLSDKDGAMALSETYIETIIDIVWSGLLCSDKDLERSSVEDMLDLNNLQIIVEAVGKAVAASMPSSKNPTTASKRTPKKS